MTNPLTGPEGTRLVPVLTYHSVGDDPPPTIHRWSVTPARLQEHLAALRDGGFTGLTVTGLLAALRGTAPLPPRPVVLTFDDGYEDFLTDALPALEAAGFPSTLYVSTGLLRDEHPAAPRPGRMLSWEQVARVAAAGVEIGAHSHTHRELDVLSRDEARYEVEHSGRRLRDELGVDVPTFAYPYGYSSRAVRAAVRDAGYTAGVGVKNAYSHAGDDPWAISRFLVERDLDAAGLLRVVGERVLPVGWRGDRPQALAWRAYRRARATGAALSEVAGGGDAPVAVRDVELSRPLPPLDPERPTQALVRLHGRPLGSLRVGPREQLADVVAEQLGPAVASHLADDGLPAAPQAPAGEPWPCRPETRRRSTSVVVPTVGRRQWVGELVRSLLDADTTPDEILVVDNRPGAETAAGLIRDLADEPRVRYLAEPVPGASQARNRGLREATGELVAFLDDDVVVDPGWLTAVHAAWDAVPHVGVVTGLILPAELDTPAQLLVQAYGGFDKGFSRKVFDLDENRLSHPLYPYLVGAYGSGANAVFDRAALTALGGFDTRLGPATPTRSGEDLDVLLRTVLSGKAVVYEPAALVRHHHRPDDAGLRSMAHDYGVGLGALFVKHLLAGPSAIVRRLPKGLALLLAPGSSRNANRREAAYPLALTLRELGGIASSPVAYARSARRARRLETDGAGGAGGNGGADDREPALSR